MTAPTVHGDATSPALVEPDAKAWLMVKGYDNNTAKWITRGMWTQSSGDPVTLTVVETSETTIASLAWFTAPRAAVTKTYTFTLTVTATSSETGTGTCTITVPPYQGA